MLVSILKAVSLMFNPVGPQDRVGVDSSSYETAGNFFANDKKEH